MPKRKNNLQIAEYICLVPNFQDNSFGFRPRRSAQQAVKVVKKALIDGWV